MKTPLLSTATALMVALSACSSSPENAPSPTSAPPANVGGSKPVMEVTTVTARIEKANPPQLVLEAKGSTRTAGWTNVRLQPRTYIQAPPDGIMDFEFVGDPPQIAAQVITAVSATNRLTAPAWLKAVRVHADKNNKEAKP